MPEQILTIVGLTALVMLSPGPDLVVVLRNTLAGGRGAGLATALGAVAGSLVQRVGRERRALGVPLVALGVRVAFLER